MTTQRKKSRATERAGVNAVRTIVEAQNCIFQEIDLGNDLGNDAYLEFVVREAATGCCIALQIKSGPSYVGSGGALFIPADRAHFEYWQSHVLPVAGLVFDPSSGRAGWCDITAHLRDHPDAIETGPYRISVPDDGQHTFSPQTFEFFRRYFMAYQHQYSDDSHFGRALEQFTPFCPPETRIEALHSLFSFHRNRAATWCYVASLVRSIENEDVLRLVAVTLSHLPGHGDIFWHSKNQVDEAARLAAVDFMRLTFGRQEIIQLLRLVDENGFARGTIGQTVHSLISLAKNVDDILRSIAFDPSINDDIRSSAMFLFVFYAQEVSVPRCIETIEEFRRSLPDSFVDEVFVEMIRVLREHGSAGFY